MGMNHWCRSFRDAHRQQEESGKVERIVETSEIATMAIPERWQAVPAVYKMIPEDPKGRKELFVGRDDELRRILGDFPVVSGSPTSRITDIMRNFVLAVTAPPGGGKSSLLRRYAEEARLHGREVIVIPPGAFASQKTMRKFVELSAAWREIQRRERDVLKARVRRGMETVRSGNMFVGSATSRNVGAEAVLLGSDGNTDGMEDVMDLVDKVKDGVELPLMDMLRVIDGQRLETGWLIMVDDAQRWRAHENDMTTRLNILSLADPHLRRASKLVGGGMLLAGLGDTGCVLDRMQFARRSELPIGNLPCDKVEQVMNLAIDTLATQEYWYEIAKNKWKPQLIKTFGTWPYHLGCVVRTLWHVLPELCSRKGACAQPHPRDALDWVETVAADKVSMLCASVTFQCTQLMGSQSTREMIELLRRQNNYLTAQELYRFIEEQKQSQKLKQDLLDVEVEEIHERLTHVGIIEPQRNSIGELLGSYKVPIPGVIKWVLDPNGWEARLVPSSERENFNEPIVTEPV